MGMAMATEAGTTRELSWDRVDWPRLKRHACRLARIDPLFRAYLLSSPRDALCSMIGCAVPERIRVRAIAERAGTLYVTIPHGRDFIFSQSAPGVIACDVLDQATCQRILARVRTSQSWQSATVKQHGRDVIAPEIRSAACLAKRDALPAFELFEPTLLRCSYQIARRFPSLELRPSSMRIVRYLPGGHYQVHRDASANNQRFISVVCYLNDGYVGGGTLFPRQRARVRPKAGRAVFFSAATPHAGERVEKGTKFIVTLWLCLQ